MYASEHQIVIAGGGPTELMLAGELALGGVDVAIVERRVNQDVESSRQRPESASDRDSRPAWHSGPFHLAG
jgi:2-polyprenyl-6-methoxyphenol hydroxylase-like FAD-dependent oxidoreductase